MTGPLHIVGGRQSARLRAAAELVPTAIIADCHRRRRGPYTGIDTALRWVLPDARLRWPDLVERHRVELLYGMPDLAELIGPAPETLASASPFAERTRFFGSSMIRCMSQGVVTFLIEYAGRLESIRRRSAGSVIRSGA